MENKRGASTHRWSVLSSILRVDWRVAGPGIVVPWQRNGGHASRVARVIMLPVLENGGIWLGIVSNSWIVSPRAKIARRSCDPSYQPHLVAPCECIVCIRSNERAL